MSIKDTAHRTFGEAIMLLEGDRMEEYGNPVTMAVRLAQAWSAILGAEVQPTEVPLMLAAMKLIRQAHSHKQDNLVDAAAYVAIAAELNA